MNSHTSALAFVLLAALGVLPAVLTAAEPVAAQELAVEPGEDALEAAGAAEAPVPSVIYRWRNRQGEVQYTDFEPVGVPSERIEVDPAAGWEDAPMLEKAGAGRPAGTSGEAVGSCAEARARLAAIHDGGLPATEQQKALASARAAVLKHCGDPASFPQRSQD